MDDNITGILIVLGTAVVLPISVIYLFYRSKMDSERNKKEIILAALKNNASIDIEELVKKMNAPDKMLKEKLLGKLQGGLVSAFLGIVFMAIAGFMGYAGDCNPEKIYMFVFGGAIFLAVGTAFIINYIVGKKLLAKEMEAEEQILRQSK